MRCIETRAQTSERREVITSHTQRQRDTEHRDPTFPASIRYFPFMF
jgi:hypothetical protein